MTQIDKTWKKNAGGLEERKHSIFPPAPLRFVFPSFFFFKDRHNHLAFDDKD